MAAASEPFNLTTEDKLSVILESASRIHIEEPAYVHQSEVIDTCMGPSLKLNALRKIDDDQKTNTDDEMDENGKSEREIVQKTRMQNSARDISGRYLDNRSLAKIDQDIKKSCSDMREKVAAAVNTDTRDVDETTLMHRQNLRLANILSTLVSACDDPDAAEDLEECHELIDMVLSGVYEEN